MITIAPSDADPGPPARVAMDEDSLRALINSKLADESLSHDHILGMLVGPGQGEICDACTLVIDTNHLVMKGVSTGRAEGAVQFHVKCFRLWDEVRTVGADSRMPLTPRRRSTPYPVQTTTVANLKTSPS